jgi:hypothetical protein
MNNFAEMPSVAPEEPPKKRLSPDEEAAFLKEKFGDKMFDLSIREAPDTRSLYRIIREKGEIQGSQKSYTADEMITLIERVMRGENPGLITSAHNLRNKVLSLKALEGK